MAGKRSFTLIEQISLMSLRGKITIVVLFVALVATVFTCTYISLAKEKEVTANNSIAQEKNETNEIDTIEEAINEIQNQVENLPKNEQIVEEVNKVTEEKTVTYKGKKVSVPKVEKAAVNDSEDQKPQSTAGTATATTVEEAKSLYEKVGNSVGIDVSKWNGNIDWAQVKASGVEFAIIRAGYRGSTVGSIMEDPYFQRNMQGAIKNGIKVGVYFFSMARTEEEAIQEAAWLVSAIRKYSITYPVAFDLESWGKGRIADVSYSQLTSNAIAFLGYVKSSGYTPMMYASKNDFNNRWETSRISGCKFWLAHYTEKTDYRGSYQMWQYSSKGSVAGISGYVDMNIAYFSYSNVAEPQHTCTFNLEKVTKEPTCTEKGTAVHRCACGDSKEEEVPAIGHKYGAWKTTINPTETKEGLEVRVCENCKNEEKKSIDKLPSSNPDKGEDTNNNTNTNTNTNTNNNTGSDTGGEDNDDENTDTTIGDDTVVGDGLDKEDGDTSGEKEEGGTTEGKGEGAGDGAGTGSDENVEGTETEPTNPTVEPIVD